MRTEQVVDNIGGLVVEVTKDHIKRGNRQQADSCPVALAIRDKILGGGMCISLEYEDLKVFVEDEVIRVKERVEGFDCLVYAEQSSRSVQRFVKRFDSRKSVKPFKFRLKSELF